MKIHEEEHNRIEKDTEKNPRWHYDTMKIWTKEKEIKRKEKEIRVVELHVNPS